MCHNTVDVDGRLLSDIHQLIYTTKKLLYIRGFKQGYEQGRYPCGTTGELARLVVNFAECCLQKSLVLLTAI